MTILGHLVGVAGSSFFQNGCRWNRSELRSLGDVPPWTSPQRKLEDGVTFQGMVNDLDRLLEAIGREASSDSSNEVFLSHLLNALLPLLDASFAALIVQVGPMQMLCVRSVPLLGSGSEQELGDLLFGAPVGFSVGQFQGARFSCHGRNGGSGGMEYLVVGHPDRRDAGADAASAGVLEAFSELMEIREAKWTSRFFRDQWGPILEGCGQFPGDRSIAAASRRMVDLLCAMLRASRVSLFQSGRSKCRPNDLLAVSSMAQPDTSSQAILEIADFASTALNATSPVRISQPVSGTQASDGATETGAPSFLLAEGMAFPLSSAGNLPLDGVLVLEWSERSAMIESLPALRQGIPVICQAWAQQVRWLRVPRWLRSARSRTAGWWSGWRSALRWVLMAGGLVACWLALQIPVPMEVVAPATLHPKLSRSIFASTDGFLKELLVEDGQSVQAGQSLLKMYSPALEIQIEEVLGRIQSLAEKRNGLNVAMLEQRNASDSSVQESRMASEIVLLEKQESHAHQELELLVAERSKLIVQSPIDGSVVARELRRELEDRPVKRGDKLFEVMDLKGAWQLHIELPDRDSIWVRNHYPADGQPVRFVLESLPRERFHGTITWIGPAIESNAEGAALLPVRADIDQKVAERGYLGARASVWFRCGSQPLWYVWTRPLVDALQIRFGWFGAKS